MYIYGLGYGLALQSPLSILLVLGAVWFSTYARIPVEEAVLESHFGESYRQYKTKTWRLFPWLY
jgi:protein-S-isoprenylcysteine O-methyltransferase Ste14